MNGKLRKAFEDSLRFYSLFYDRPAMVAYFRQQLDAWCRVVPLYR